MSKARLRPSSEAWDVGARVAIFDAVDAERWTTLGPLLRRALTSGHAVVVADQGLDPLADRLSVLAADIAVPLQRWPARQAGRGWQRFWPRHTTTAALPRFEDLLWIDFPESGLDVAGFVPAVQDWLTAHAERPLVVLAHDLAWREDAGGLAGLWDAAAASEGRLCAILTAPGLPSNPWARAALLEASLVGVHRVDSPADAAVLAGYFNQSLEDGVREHGIAVHDRTNVLPISAFFVTVPERGLPLVLVDAAGRPDFEDLFRVTDLEQEPPETRVAWLVSPPTGRERSIQMTCQVVRPVTTAYTLWFRAPEHTALLRRIGATGRFLLGIQPTVDEDAVDAWVMDGRLPSTVQTALDQW
jgi:hypothetical protein